MHTPKPISGAKRSVATDGTGKGYAQAFASLPLRKYRIAPHPNRLHLLHALDYHARLRVGVGLPNWCRYLYLLRRTRRDPIVLVHLYNAISLGTTPWLASFEARLPFPPIASRRVLKASFERLRADACKKLLALSRAAYNEQARFLDRVPGYRDAVSAKTSVLHPAQPALVDSFVDKNLPSEPITFTLVGAEFFRKGGAETLKVFQELLQKKYPVRLNIVSSFERRHALFEGADIDASLRLIAKYPQAIRHVGHVPHAQVLEILRGTHVALLPTYSDTYGFFVLEAQASACPVVTTDVRALPEINNESIGWIIPVPKDEWGDSGIRDERSKRITGQAIEEGLRARIEQILADPGTVGRKGAAALARIRAEHDPEERAAQLESIYDEILGLREEPLTSH